MANETQQSNGVGFTSLLQLLFIALKLTHAVSWSWLVVFLPFIVGAGIWLGLVVLLTFLAALGAIK